MADAMTEDRMTAEDAERLRFIGSDGKHSLGAVTRDEARRILATYAAYQTLADENARLAAVVATSEVMLADATSALARRDELIRALRARVGAGEGDTRRLDWFLTEWFGMKIGDRDVENEAFDAFNARGGNPADEADFIAEYVKHARVAIDDAMRASAPPTGQTQEKQP